MKYTIVVPLYNCEAYIEKCLHSLLCQDFENYEIVVVNDGSTDRSLEVARNCTKMSDKVRILSQKNRGLSGARNTGIREAKGKYLIFIDADDYAEPTLLSSVDKVLDDSDLLMYGYYNDVYRDDKLILSDERTFSCLDVKECAKKMQPALLSGLIGYAWNKVYKRSVLLKHGLLFREGTALVEDIIFNNDVFSCTDNVGVFCEALVHYVQRENRETLSKKKYSNLTELLIESFVCRKNFFKKYDPQNYKKSLMKIFVLMLSYLLSFSNKSNNGIVDDCLTFFYACREDIQPTSIADVVVLFLVETKLIVIVLFLKEMKNGQEF